MADWLPAAGENPSAQKPLSFRGPFIITDKFYNSIWDDHDTLHDLLSNKGFLRSKLVPEDIPKAMSMTPRPMGSFYKMIAPEPSLTNSLPPRALMTVDGSVTNASRCGFNCILIPDSNLGVTTVLLQSGRTRMNFPLLPLGMRSVQTSWNV